MIYEFRKWINIKVVLVFMLIIILNIFLFRLHTLNQDHLLLDEYDHYLSLLVGEEEPGNVSYASTYYAKQLAHIAQYPDYIRGMPSRAQDAYMLSGGSISTYTRRNIAKTVQDYEGLEKLFLEIGLDQQVIRSLSFTFTDLIFVGIIFFIVTSLFTKEYEDQIYPLLIATAARTSIAWNKITYMTLILLFVTIGLYTGNIIMAGYIYGWDDLGRNVQSISQFRSLAHPMTVGSYFAISLIIKWLNGVMHGLFIFALLTILKKAVPVILLMASVWGVALIVFVTIPVNSVWNAFHFINPIYGFDTYSLIRSYQNVNILNYPVAVLHLWPAICIVASILSTTIITIQYKRAAVLHSSISFKKGVRIRQIIRANLDHLNARGGIFFAELNKTLFSNKAILVLLFLIALLFYRVDRSYRFADADRMAYSHYIERFNGEVSADTLLRIETERDKLMADASHDIVKIELDALDRVHGQLKRVLKLEEEQGIPAYLVNDDHYAQWMDNRKADQRDLIFSFLASILATAGIFAKEKLINAHKLIRITPEHKRVRIYKTCITILLSLIITILLLVARYYEFLKFDRLSNLDAPVQSHEGWSSFPLLWDMRTYFSAMILLAKKSTKS